MQETFKDKDQKKIVTTYYILAAALLLSFIPALWAAAVSTLIFIFILAAAYGLRAGAADGTLLENHMTFIIRTMWISCLVSLVTMSLAGLYLFQVLDNTPLTPCVDRLVSGGADPMAMDSVILQGIFAKCWPAYWASNLKAFVIGGAMTIVPVFVYFLLRLLRGYTRAQNGYRIANPKSWL